MFFWQASRVLRFKQLKVKSWSTSSTECLAGAVCPDCIAPCGTISRARLGLLCAVPIDQSQPGRCEPENHENWALVLIYTYVSQQLSKKGEPTRFDAAIELYCEKGKGNVDHTKLWWAETLWTLFIVLLLSLKCFEYVSKKSKTRRQYRIPQNGQGDSQRSDERNMTLWYFQIF